MLIVLLLAVLLLALGAAVIAPAVWYLGRLWPAIPRSNADFEWLDV